MNSSIASTPPSSAPLTKKRRGRPPKTSPNSISPAATNSAAALRQGIPKVSSPLMRVRKRTGSFSSPINPSPKGGLLMSLNDENFLSNNGASLTSPLMTKSIKKSVNFYELLPKTSHNISLLTNGGGNSSSSLDTSVNPSLLLSSPVIQNSTSKVLISKSLIQHSSSGASTLSTNNISSSPMTPNSSCFSAIMQSSPFNPGYYTKSNDNNGNNNLLPSPSSMMNSSPIRNKTGLKKNHTNRPTKIQRINELPKNPFNSPILKSANNSSTVSEFTLSLTVDEFGQAKLFKEIKPSKLNKTKPSTPKLPKLEKSQPNNHALNEMFIEPSKMINESFFTNELPEEFNDKSHTTNALNPLALNHQYTTESIHNVDHINDINSINHIGEDSNDENDDDEDDDQNFDARKALIKMIRRSV